MRMLAKLRRFRIFNDGRLLEFFPPFLFMGVKVLSVASDYRYLHLRIPMKWYATNLHGTMFGGVMCAVSDPLAALMCEKIFAGTQAWTKRNCVDFLRPAAEDLDLRIRITDKDISLIERALHEQGQATHTFRYDFTDRRSRVVAKVSNVVFLRAKR